MLKTLPLNIQRQNQTPSDINLVAWSSNFIKKKTTSIKLSIEKYDEVSLAIEIPNECIYKYASNATFKNIYILIK